ncbi:MAG: MATE family efflux transporter [Clostridia bacterium]
MGKTKPTNEQILSEMPTARAIRRLAVPAIMGTLITAVYNLVDTAFIGMLHATEALSAIAIAFPIMALLNAIGQILGVGAAACIGIALGAKRQRQAGEIATTVIVLSLVCGAAFAALGLFFQTPIFRFFGASDAVLPYARQYGTWMYVGAIFTIPNQALNNVARAETNAKLSAVALGVGALVNLILDPLFMFDFGMGLGIAGASIATLIAQGVSFALLMGYFLRGKALLRLTRTAFRPTRKMLWDVLKTGSPSGASQVLVSLSVAVTNVVAAGYGDFVVAALGVVLKVISFGQFIIFGYVQGFQPIASYSFGAKNHARLAQAFQDALKFVVLTCGLMTIVYIALRYPILRVFSQDPSVLAVAAPILVSQVLLYVAMGVVILMTALFQSIDRGLQGIVLSIARQGIFFFPLLFLFTRYWGLTGLYFTQPASDLLSLALAFLLYRRVKRHLSSAPQKASGK